MFLLPYNTISMDARHDVLELSRFMTELSVIDYYFVVHRPSSVALAALLNAMEDVAGASDGALQGLLKEVNKFDHVDTSSPEVLECRNRLRLLYAQGGYSPPEARVEEARTETISPVCVSYGCNVYPQDAYAVEQEQKQMYGSPNKNRKPAATDSRNSSNVPTTAQPPAENPF